MSFRDYTQRSNGPNITSVIFRRGGKNSSLNAYKVTSKDHTETRERVWNVRYVHPVPDEMHAVIGDSIHNLRCTLMMLFTTSLTLRPKVRAWMPSVSLDSIFRLEMTPQTFRR